MKQEAYRFTVETGDVVQMTDGTMAVVTGWDIIWGGLVKEIRLHPFTGFWHRLWLSFTGRLRPCEEGIDRLVKIGSVCVA